MLTIVMKNPMEVTIVSAVPLYCRIVDCATRVENCGESETTVVPQINKKKRNKGCTRAKLSGAATQQKNDVTIEIKATLLLPILFEMIPPIIQPAQPAAMTKKLHREEFTSCPFLLYR